VAPVAVSRVAPASLLRPGLRWVKTASLMPRSSRGLRADSPLGDNFSQPAGETHAMRRRLMERMHSGRRAARVITAGALPQHFGYDSGHCHRYSGLLVQVIA